MKTKKSERVSLDLNQEVHSFIKMRLEQFAAEYPDDYAEIIGNLEEFCDDLLVIFFNYLKQHNHPSLGKRMAEITGKSRQNIYLHLKKTGYM